jgi:hypothetical protein
MPTSMDPPPADDEIECGNCGAHIYHELTRCPKCGVNLYAPEDETAQAHSQEALSTISPKKGILTRLDELWHQVTKRPYSADELFGAAINQAELFNDLLRKVGGDRPTVERLIAYERQQLPQGNRLVWLENAIRRWERDNRESGDNSL